MWITFLLVVGSVLLVVAGFTWVARREAVDRARAITGLSLTPLADVKASSLQAVRAAVAREGLVHDPVIDEDVAFYEARLARVDGGERVLKALRGGDRAVIEDAGARAEVELEGAELDIGWEELDPTDGEPSPRMARLLRDAGVPVPEPDRAARYVLFHHAIRLSDRLTVVGTPRFDARGAQQASGQTAYRGGGGAHPTFSANGLLIVTDADLSALAAREERDVAAMRTMLRIATGVGAVLVAVGVTLVALR